MDQPHIVKRHAITMKHEKELHLHLQPVTFGHTTRQNVLF